MYQTEINYNNIHYNFNYLVNDHSGTGSILEIISQNEYALERFENIENEFFLDIGANYGLASIILAKQNPGSIIYSFEPNPDVFEVFLKNIKDNDIKNIIPYNKALHSNKNFKLMKHPYCSGANIMSDDKKLLEIFYIKHGITQIEDISVDTISIDEFINQANIKKIFLLKIDCEGSEFDILGNSENIFKTVTISNIVGEFHDLSYNKTKLTSSELLELCKKNINGVVDIKLLTL